MDLHTLVFRLSTCDDTVQIGNAVADYTTPGPNMTRDEAIRIIRRSRFADMADELVALLRPGMQMYPQRTKLDALPSGASHLGGQPDVPAGFEWPRTPTGHPLSFLAQIHLPDVRPADPEELLPSIGWLCFFYDFAEEPWGLRGREHAHWRVVYFDTDTGALQRNSEPMGKEIRRTPACSIRWELSYTLPSREEAATETARMTGQNASGERPQKWLPQQLAWWTKDLGQLTEATPQGTPNHHVLGHPQEIQGNMPSEFHLAVENQPQRVEQNPFLPGQTLTVRAERRDDCPDWVIRLLRDSRDWRLLLQLDTDDNGTGWTWGDCGRLYFWLPEAELRARRFDHTWLNLQCY